MRILAVLLLFAVCAYASESVMPLAKNYGIYSEMYSLYKGGKRAKIAMFGDSITQSVYWNELLDRPDVINRGIPGDTTEGMLRRLNTVNPGRLEQVFIMAGINDFAKYRETPEVFDRYVRIINYFVKSGVYVHVQSTLYLSPKAPNHKTVNAKVRELNALLKDYALKHRLDYIDLNEKLSDKNGLIMQYSYDGTHLNAKGYEVWGKIIRKRL